MAGLGGMPYFIKYQGELQDQQRAQQLAAIQQQQSQQQQVLFQQQQQDRQRQAQAQAAVGNALPQMFAPPPQQPQQAPAQAMGVPPPQPPMPGQPSQPMQQMPPPPQQPQGLDLSRVPPQMQQQLMRQNPQAFARGAQQFQQTSQPQQPPPYQAMPTTPPAQPQGPQAIGAPPQPAQPPAPPQGQMTLEGAVKTLQAQGLQGADLMVGLQHLMPMLDAQSKAQAAAAQQQFNQQIKVEQLKTAHDNLEERKREADQRAEDRSLDRAQRAQAHADSIGIQRESIALRKQTLAAGGDAAFSKDDLKFLAEQQLAGDNSVYQNLGRGVQGAKNVVNLRKEVVKMANERGMSGADIAAANVGYMGEKAAARTAGVKATNVELAAAEAQKTFPLVREASAALPRSEFVPANRALQAAQTNTGDPRVIALGTAINTAVNAYSRAISPSGTPTQTDKEHARELMSTANTPEQLNAVLKMMEKEMSAARAAPKEVKAAQHERISGKNTETGGGIPAGWSVTER